MSDDLPIKVTLDPAPAARGAQTLVREVAKVEDQAKKTTTSFAGLEKQLGNIEREASKAAKGVSSINFKQAASGAWQGFSKVSSELGLLENKVGRVVTRTVEMGATGAQIAGPWGAAIGSIIGVGTTLLKQMFDQEAELKKIRKEAEEAGRAYWEATKAAELRTKIEAELASTMAEHAKVAGEIADRERTLNSVLNASGDTYRKATDRAQAYADQLYKVNAALAIQMRMAGVNPNYSGPQTDDEATTVNSARGLRDAKLEADASTVSYGKTWLEFEQAANKRNDRLRDLEQIMSEQRASDSAQKAAFKEYNELIKEGTKAIDAQEQAWRRLLVTESQRRNVLDTIDTRVDVTAGFKVTPNSDPLVDAAMREQYALNSTEPNKLTAMWRRELEAIQAKGIETTQMLSSGFQGVAQSIGQAVASGMNFEQTLLSISASMLELFINGVGQHFFGSGGAGIGSAIPGFASGGYIPPGGAGGTDSQLVAIRKSPWESVHINTPSQEAAMMGGGGGSRNITINLTERDIVRTLEGANGESTVLRVVTRAFPWLRSPSGRSGY